MKNQTEIFDVVDADDRVIGQASRKEVHEQGLLHRSVHILVFNETGELFLQKRSLNKDENPGMWDTSAAGHVEAGEDYLFSAERELEEELGIREPLSYVDKVAACPGTFGEHVKIYRCTTRQSIRINREEIDEGQYWALESLASGLREQPERFTSTLRLIYTNYLKIKE